MKAQRTLVKELSTYADVTPVHDETFWKFGNLVSSSLDNASDLVKSNNSYYPVSHLCPDQWRGREGQNIFQLFTKYQELEDLRFAEQGLDNLQLCVIDSSMRYDGFL